MGINRQTLKFMLTENEHRPFEGEFLSFGKQSITILEEQLRKTLTDFDFDGAKKFEPDTESRAGQKFQSISDVSLFSIFPNLKYSSSDHSSYENANLIIDLNKPCPAQYRGKFDLIYTGGTLDNIFNPAQGLINMYEMLKPGGRALITEATAYHAGVYCAMSPEWLSSLFAANQCEDVQVYSYCARSSVNQWVFETDLFKWDPHFTRQADFDYVASTNSVGGQMYSMVVAEKSMDPADETMIPIQAHYLQPENFNWVQMFEKYRLSKRKAPLTDAYKDDVVIPLLTDHFSYVGSEY